MKKNNVEKRDYKVKFAIQQIVGILAFALLFTVLSGFYLPIMAMCGIKEDPDFFLIFLVSLALVLVLWMFIVLTQLKSVYKRYCAEWEYKRTRVYIIEE